MTSALDYKLEFGPLTLAQVAHDVRASVSSISAFLELATDDQEPEAETFEDLLPLAQRGISRLLFVAELLTILSDVMDSRGNVLPVPSEPRSLVRAAVREASRLTVHTLTDPQQGPDLPLVEIDPNVTIPCVAALINRVWLRAGTTVSLRLTGGDEGVELRIESSDASGIDGWCVVTPDDDVGVWGENLRARLTCAGHAFASENWAEFGCFPDGVPRITRPDAVVTASELRGMMAPAATNKDRGE